METNTTDTRRAVPVPPVAFTYEAWRHGGWYVAEVRHENGGSGCVARAAGGGWAIACPASGWEDLRFPNRDAAALAEWAMVTIGRLAGAAVAP